MADHSDITRDIIIKLIETEHLSLKKHDAINKDYATVNEYNAQEVCKTYRVIYNAVKDTWNGN